jgi:hypothetical protein
MYLTGFNEPDSALILRAYLWGFCCTRLELID